LARLLGGLPRECELSGVVHAAGCCRCSGEGLSAEQVGEVLRVKVDGARHLDELSRIWGCRVCGLFIGGWPVP